MNDRDLVRQLRSNLDTVEGRMAAACARAGRRRDEVTLVAITKYVSARVAGLLHTLGAVDLGESRPQELWKKAAELPASVRWHLVGHLQRNKIDRTIPLVTLIHSVDSPRLLQALEAAAAGGTVRVLVEVNLSDEANKTGLPSDALDEILSCAVGMHHVRIEGLMTMAARADPNECRPTFAALRRLGNKLPANSRRELSMGMSNDFEVAIEEGATMVRIGSCLFEGIAPEVLRS